MEDLIKCKIQEYKELYNQVYDDRAINGDKFSDSDMEYLDTLEMMLDDLEELKLFYIANETK